MDKNFKVFFKQLQEQFGGPLNCKTVENGEKKNKSKNLKGVRR